VALLVTAPTTVTSFSPAVVDGTRKGLVSSCHHRSLTHDQHALFDQGSRDCRSRAAENAGEGRAGNAHPLRCSFLVEPLEVRQAKGFEFVQPQWLHCELAD